MAVGCAVEAVAGKAVVGDCIVEQEVLVVVVVVGAAVEVEAGGATDANPGEEAMLDSGRSCVGLAVPRAPGEAEIRWAAWSRRKDFASGHPRAQTERRADSAPRHRR